MFLERFGFDWATCAKIVNFPPKSQNQTLDAYVGELKLEYEKLFHVADCKQDFIDILLKLVY